MEKLTQYLKDNKIPQHRFADMLGVKQPTVSRICTGVAMPSIKLMVKIEKATGGSVPVLSWFDGVQQ